MGNTAELIAFFVAVCIFLLIIGELPQWIYSSLATPRFRIGNWNIDWWYISHFWFYMVVGAVCPGKFWVFTTLGVVFELFESGIGAAGTKMQSTRAKKQLDEFYWFGRWEDVAVNSLGYLIGEFSTIRTRLKHSSF
jgi:hypothetical protein